MLTLTFETSALIMALTLAILIFGFAVAKTGIDCGDCGYMPLIYTGTSIMVFSAGMSVCMLILLIFIL